MSFISSRNIFNANLYSKSKNLNSDNAFKEILCSKALDYIHFIWSIIHTGNVCIKSLSFCSFLYPFFVACKNKVGNEHATLSLFPLFLLANHFQLSANQIPIKSSIICRQDLHVICFTGYTYSGS